MTFALPHLLAGKVALVTGAGQGNGRAIALGLARSGARVAVTDLNAHNAAETVALIQAEGGQGWSCALDVTDAQACREVVSRVASEVGAIDLLVNNAGILIRETIDSPEAERQLKQVMKVNFDGTFHMIHASLGSLRQTKGAVVNIASIASFIGQANSIGYSPSKGAVKMLTQSLAVDLAKDGIRINAIAPGMIATAMSSVTRADPAKLEKFMTRVPMGRPADPDELVGAVLFLGSSMSTYVTGITVPVDGGLLAA